MKANVFIVCTGVGHITRGYESFTNECFQELKGETEFETYLLKGGGASKGKEIKVACIQRGSKLANFVFRITRREKYWIEQATFLIGMIPALIQYRPSVILYSDFILGTFLWHLRRFLKFRYKLIFSNGAPNGPPFITMDHVQQLLPMYIKEAVAANTPLQMQTLLPYAINIDKETNLGLLTKQGKLRKELNLPLDRKVLICVGAVNSSHKRIDYLVKEFSKLSNDYFLLVLGHIDEKSASILQLAKEILPADAYTIKQVDGSMVRNYLCASDYFILPSLNEGLPRVLPEALAAGLLPIVHDYQVTKETLKGHGVFRDLTKEHVLYEAIAEADSRNIAKEELVDFAYNTYSWHSLRSSYVNLVKKFL